MGVDSRHRGVYLYGCQRESRAGDDRPRGGWNQISIYRFMVGTRSGFPLVSTKNHYQVSRLCCGPWRSSYLNTNNTFVSC